MTLPQYIYTNTAGSPSASNQKWGPVGTDGSGNPLYQNTATLKPYWRWDRTDLVWVCDTNDSASSDSGVSISDSMYFSNGGQTLASGPVGTYAVGPLGVAPAPIVSTSASPQNFVLAFFTPSAGGSPSLSASWQQPAQGQPDSYNIKLGGASGAEALALNVPGSVLSHTFPAYGYGTVYGIITAVYGGTEGSPSGEAGASAPVPPPTLTATGELAGGVPAILLSVH